VVTVNADLTTGTYGIDVQALDNHSLAGPTSHFTINVSAAPNQAPTGMKFTMDLAGLTALQGADGNGFGSNHDLATNASLGTFAATDPDSDPLTWSLTGAQAGQFSIGTSTGILSTGSTTLAHNFTYSFNVVVNDGHGHTLSQTASVFVGANGTNAVTLSSDFNIAYGLGNPDTFNSTAGTDFFVGGADGDTLSTGSRGGTLVGGATIDQLTAGNHAVGGRLSHT
jgi:hypothetical protein